MVSFVSLFSGNHSGRMANNGVAFLEEQAIWWELLGDCGGQAVSRINNGPRASLRVCVRQAMCVGRDCGNVFFETQLLLDGQFCQPYPAAHVKKSWLDSCSKKVKRGRHFHFLSITAWSDRVFCAIAFSVKLAKLPSHQPCPPRTQSPPALTLRMRVKNQLWAHR